MENKRVYLNNREQFSRLINGWDLLLLIIFCRCLRSVGYDPFSLGEKVPAGRMRVLSGGTALKESNSVYVYWIKTILIDSHPTVIVFPQHVMYGRFIESVPPENTLIRRYAPPSPQGRRDHTQLSANNDKK